jgi:hypothetical protein
MRKILLFLALVFFGNVFCKEEKIKLYTFYTPSHEQLYYEWFLPGIQDDFELVVVRCEQDCTSGVYKTEGWLQAMLRKVDLVINAIEENWGKIFVYADIDIRFYRSFKKMIPRLMKNNDMVIQTDNPFGQVCAGFFMCKGNEKTLNLWKSIRKTMIQNLSQNIARDDQDTINSIIRGEGYKGVVWDYLPIEFFGGGTLTGKQWKPGVPLVVPDNIILHHANYTKGIKNKVIQMEYVKNIVNNRV